MSRLEAWNNVKRPGNDPAVMEALITQCRVPAKELVDTIIKDLSNFPAKGYDGVVYGYKAPVPPSTFYSITTEGLISTTVFWGNPQSSKPSEDLVTYDSLIRVACLQFCFDKPEQFLSWFKTSLQQCFPDANLPG
jgi:hypothetical protein